MFFVLGWFCYQNAALCRMSSDGLLFQPSTRFSTIISNCGFSEKTEALLQALLTGHREMLDTNTIQAFRESGASHILALSGLHLGIIYGILVKALSIIGNNRTASCIRSVFAIGVCMVYCLSTGCSPSLIRAFIFITINEISHHFSGRRRRPAAVLCTALMIQLIADPKVIESLGFQLSYFAMSGIILIYPKMESWYESDDGRFDVMRKIWTSAALTVSCQIFTAPLIWVTFRTFPKYFLLTNLIALPLTEFLIISSFVCLCVKALCLAPFSDAMPFLGKIAEATKELVEWGADSLTFHLNIISSM